jgi:hypothetical protein
MLEPRYTRDEYGYAVLEIEVDGCTARLHPLALKRTLVQEGYVFLGAEFEDDVPPIILPANEDLGRGEMTLYGFTADPDIVAVTRAWLRRLDAGVLDVESSSRRRAPDEPDR